MNNVVKLSELLVKDRIMASDNSRDHWDTPQFPIDGKAPCKVHRAQAIPLMLLVSQSMQSTTTLLISPHVG